MFLKRKFPQAVDARIPSEMRDVVDNVTTLLNARRGASSFHHAFGLEVTQFRAQADAMEAVSHQIRENLNEFEPRLELLEIEEQYDDNGKPYLEVVCKLRSTGEKLKIISTSAGRAFTVAPFDPLAPEPED